MEICATDPFSVYFFQDWADGYLEREKSGPLWGESCNFADFPSPPANSSFIKGGAVLRTLAHEVGHLLLDDPYHYKGTQKDNLMDVGPSLQDNLDSDQIQKMRKSRLAK
jgi:hypothetical protein